jgi:Ser/Thr protein kinase RdoA (MazF antagonist)
LRNQLEYKGETIKAIPIPRGELKKIVASASDKDKDTDAEIVKGYCKEPSFTDAELKHAKPLFITMITNTVLSISGINPNKGRKKAPQEKEDEFAKN